MSTAREAPLTDEPQAVDNSTTGQSATAALRPCEDGDCPAVTPHTHDWPDPTTLADDFGGRVQVMHGSVCVGLVIHDKPGLVLTPQQARTLAAMLTRQAEHAEATYA